MTTDHRPLASDLMPKTAWFLAFTAVFAVLAGFVFWGTWSLDFAPVMPDDNTVHSLAYGDYWDKALRDFIKGGQILPSDIFWKGLLVSPYFCQELKYAVALFCCALGMAFFLRGRGLSRLASYGAGLFLAFSGYWCTLFSAGHGGWFCASTYTVFLFGLGDRAVRMNALRHWLLLGLVAGWCLMCQPDFMFIMALLAGLYFVWACIRERTFPWKGILIATGVGLVVGATGFKSAFALKQVREEQISKGETVAKGAPVDEKEKRWIFVTNWSLPAAETAEFFIPRLNGDTSCPLTLSVGMRYGTGVKPYTGALGRPKDAPQGNYRQHSLYVGWITCLLAVVGCLGTFKSKRHRSDVWFFIGAALFFWLLSLGRNFEPLYRIVFALPVGDSLRAPVKWHHLTEFCLVVLAGHGVHGLMEWACGKFERFGRLSSRWCLVALGAVVLFGAFDLARVDKLYCAPVDMRQMRKTNSSMQMNVLRRQDFANPQVAEMVKRGQIVSLANYLGNPDYFLVEMLTPRKPAGPRAPLPPMTFVTWLGVLSLLASLGVCVYVGIDKVRKDRAV